MGSIAVDAARRTGDRPTLIHTLKTSLWHGLTPDLATVQLARSTELAACAPRPATARSSAWPRSTARS